ncbi:MAG: hypothetical protein GEV08_12605 [Acidimicrobiia bacterium]|nr:hypothetical protein [Acidimicrobiia bacterium]
MSMPDASPRKYVPRPEGLNLEFFRHAGGGALHLQRCDECGSFRHPPRHYCQRCFSPRYSYVPSSGRGTVYSWVTSHFTVDRGWVAEVPYTTVVVELDEGPRLVGALRGLDVEDLRLGLPVVLVGEPKGDDFVFFWVDAG